VAAIQEQEVDIVALSALLPSTMPNMKVIIEALNEAGLRERVKVIIGGGPCYGRVCSADRCGRLFSRCQLGCVFGEIIAFCSICVMATVLRSNSQKVRIEK
jgi:cobalamin-dependent methionine synthase I